MKDDITGHPPDELLRRLRIPFVRRVTLESEDGTHEETFSIDIGLEGIFVERAEPLPYDAILNVRFAWPGSEVPFRGVCRVAWWHPQGEPLHSKSLPAGVGLQFTEMSETDRERLRANLVEYCGRDPQVRRFLRHWPDTAVRDDDPTAV